MGKSTILWPFSIAFCMFTKGYPFLWVDIPNPSGDVPQTVHSQNFCPPQRLGHFLGLGPGFEKVPEFLPKNAPPPASPKNSRKI
jgi:hypothetical protein